MSGGPDVDPLVIRSLEFLGGMATAGTWRPESDMPEIAFAGRSNVGKSSLLNRLVRRKAFARVSRTPGRTREINFFRVNNLFVLADLPGYGYAKISKERKADWKPLIEGYLSGTPNLAGVVQLLDIRRDPSEDDVSMLDFLAELGAPTVVVLTKTDKVSRRHASERADLITRSLGIDPDQTISFSAATGEGREDLASALVSLIAATNDATRQKE
ncbi:MAG TPA: ribosome biogenesis GTP-binding protein YihA/YsxC [Gemmatimonadaceae bacterium]|nr:ribosome biogenesis GTP-binding protein YihA/YsxC [Gemmatimonadaceae bacterium]